MSQSLVATISLIVLLVMIWWTVTHPPKDGVGARRQSWLGDERTVSRLITGAAVLIVGAGVVAVVWTLVTG